MAVRMRTTMCGPSGNAYPGDIVRGLGEEAEKHLLATSQAEPVSKTPAKQVAAEEATDDARETAVGRSRRGASRRPSGDTR